MNRTDKEQSFHWREADNPEKDALTAWAIFPSGTKYFDPSRAGHMINYRVDDLDASLAALKPEGVEVDPHREDYDYAALPWIINPDGNRIKLWEPSQEKGKN